MATSRYFNCTGHNGTQKLIDDLVQEMIELRGIDIKYIPRSIVEKFPITNDANHRFDQAFDIEAYMQDYQGFNTQMWEKFGGIQLQDEVTFSISRRRFAEVIGNGVGLEQQPQEGDLIYLPLANKIFKVNNPNNDEDFMQFGKWYTYSLPCTLFQYGNENFDTGVPEIDDIDKRLSILDEEGDPGVYKDSSLQTDNAQADVLEQDLALDKLKIDFGD
ncbi:putative neck protein [Salmonella phage pSal-SNUABM-02]|nr:putative neck protein [Salmonella phage pSal-SNUABM-02]